MKKVKLNINKKDIILSLIEIGSIIIGATTVRVASVIITKAIDKATTERS